MEITRPKRLKVIILRGRAILSKIGFTKKLRNPKKAPTKTKVPKTWLNSTPGPGITNIGPMNSTPGTNFTASKIPKIPAIICNNRRLISQ